MKKRLCAIFLIICMLMPLFAFAQSTDQIQTEVDIEMDGLTVIRNHQTVIEGKQKISMDYPTFETEDETLKQLLDSRITQLMLAMRKIGQMSSDEADYAQGKQDMIRGGYFANNDFPNILSIEASVRNQAANASTYETALIYGIFDLQNKRSVAVNELFVESKEDVEATIKDIAFAKATELGIQLNDIADGSAMPMPGSYYITSSHFRCIYAAGVISTNGVTIDSTWDELSLTQSSLLTSEAAQLPEQADEPLDEVQEDEPVFNDYEEMELEELDEVQTQEPSVTQDPVVTQESLVTQEPVITQEPIVDAIQEPQAAATLDPGFALPAVITPTPMPLAASDAVIVDVLTHGLWKELGTDGRVYYQFTEDGKLLTVSVSDYTVTEGNIQSSIMNGELEIGSDSAFTLREADAAAKGYVLNRQGEAVAPEEFVTPSPTPVPTPTPTPSPSPSPSPTPTLSPYEVARSQAPNLAALSDVAFKNIQTEKVYTAPDADAYRASKAQVTTDETVSIYGVEGDWALVAYSIGDGSRGRIGYIDAASLEDVENVAHLGFASIPITLTKSAKSTDDPINGKTTFVKLSEGTEVTLLAFMGNDWAYIETMYKEKVCRLFIPQAALMEE